MFGRTGGTRTHRLLTLIQQGIPIPCHCPVIIWRGAKDLNLDLSALDLLSALQCYTNFGELVPVVGVEPTLCRFWVYRLCQLGYTGIKMSGKHVGTDVFTHSTTEFIQLWQDSNLQAIKRLFLLVLAVTFL